MSPARSLRVPDNVETTSAAMEAVPIAIFETDALGSVTFVNDRWCELTGLSATNALGAGWMRVLHPDDLERVIAEWQAAVTQAREVRIEFRIVRPDGRLAWVDGRVFSYQWRLPDKVWSAAAAQVRAELEAAATDLHAPRAAGHRFQFLAVRF